MEEKPDFSFWLKEYQVKRVNTKKEVKVLKRYEEYELPVAGGVDRRYHELSGGVQLMAIALRLKAGDVTALKKAVFKMRPKPDALSWRFVVGEWLIPTSPEMLKVEDVCGLFIHAESLLKKKYYDDVIALCNQIIGLKPEWDAPYYTRAYVFDAKDQWDRAMSDLDRVLEINPSSANAYCARSIVRLRLTNPSNPASVDFGLAIADCNRALEINPMLAEAYCTRGIIHFVKGNLGNKNEYSLAVADFNRALEINSKSAETYFNRGLMYFAIGSDNLAIADFNCALELKLARPGTNVDAYIYRGGAYLRKGQWDKALSDLRKAHEIDPTFFENKFPEAAENFPFIEDLNKRIRKLDVLLDR
jgi:tetratricopeptide (TPR) repeat protein